jgi:hypothetical protein
MSRQMRNQDLVVIGKQVALTASATINTLADGEVRFFTPGGVFITGANDTAGIDFIIVVGGANSKPRFVSEPIKSSIITATSTNYAAATQQSTYLGYNGSTGSITATDENLYMVSIYQEDYLRSSHDGRYMKHFQYKSDASATQAEIAIGLAGSAIDNFSREPKNTSGDPFLKFKAVCSEAVTAGNDFDNAISWVKGGRTILCTTNVQYGGGTAAVVGDFIRLATSEATTVLTDDVYKIVGISSLTITVDRPIQVAAYTDTGNNSTGNEVLTAAEGAAANWGVYFNGQAQDHVNGKEFDKIVRYNYRISLFGTTTVTDVAAVAAVGSIAQVKDHEWFSKGNEGEIYRVGEPAIHTFASDVVVTSGGYNITTITWTDSHVVGFQNNHSPKQITIYSPDAAAGPAAQDATYMSDNTDGNWVTLLSMGANATVSGLTDLE